MHTFYFFFAFISAYFLITVSASGWEYKAVYEINEDFHNYSINLANNADTTMKICFCNTDEASGSGIGRWMCTDDMNATPLYPYNSSHRIVVNRTYELMMNSDTWLSIFNIDFPGSGFFAFFAQHYPSEFHFPGGTDMEMLKDSESHDVAASYVAGASSSHGSSTVSNHKWRDVMLGCFAVWSMTLSGLILLVYLPVWELVKPYVFMFASGTLISTAFCLVLYESTHLITDQSSSESEAAGKWASMVIVGFLSSPVCNLILQATRPIYSTVSTAEDKDMSANNAEGGGIELATNTKEKVAAAEEDISQVSISQVDKEEKFSIIFALLVGDFFHNFADGVFIGSAFQCNVSLAWKLVGITIAHELPQEIGDFSVITGRLGFSTSTAILYNGLSGLSVMLGGIVVLSQDLQSNDIGMLLAYGAGNYIYAATVHLFKEAKNNARENAMMLLFFCIGAIAIGLILLEHEHCSAEAAEGEDTGGHAAH